MTQETDSKPDIEGFINKHVVKVLWAVVIYFLMNLSTDFKEVKITLQQLLINQATVDSRLGNLEASDRKQEEAINKNTEARILYTQSAKLNKN